MLKKLMMTTALSGLMIGAAMAQTQPAPEQKPVSEPQAIQAQSTTSTSPSTATTGVGQLCQHPIGQPVAGIGLQGCRRDRRQ